MELYEAGYKFVGIPNVFIIHWDHGVPKWRNKGDFVRVRVWINYFNFLEEIQMKYKTTIPAKWLFERDMRREENHNFRKLLMIMLFIIVVVFLWSVRSNLRRVSQIPKMKD